MANEGRNGADPLSDERGPIPEFPPAILDADGRLVPISEEDRWARADALRRTLKAIASIRDEADDEDELWRSVLSNLGVPSDPDPLRESR